MTSLSPPAFLGLVPQQPLIDVRSPGEFAQGHIPGAMNVPLFDDDQRAQLGLTYRERGHDAAVNLGYRLANPRREQLVHQVHRACQTAPSPVRQVLVHCWRGGMRSREFANLLVEHGFQPILLTGGYKAFRREVLSSFESPRPIMILSGMTGSGKTQLLHALAADGQQVIDLEALAHHRGSTFGSLGQPPQPTTEQFENQLYWQWRDLDPKQPVWFEGESRAIGRIKIPQPLWEQLLRAPEVFVEVPRRERVAFLVEEYGDFPREQLAESLNRIKKRLGGVRLMQALAALERGELAVVVEIVLDYYDKSYAHASRTQAVRAISKLQAERAADLTLVGLLTTLGRTMIAESLLDSDASVGSTMPCGSKRVVGNVRPSVSTPENSPFE